MPLIWSCCINRSGVFLMSQTLFRLGWKKCVIKLMVIFLVGMVGPLNGDIWTNIIGSIKVMHDMNVIKYLVMYKVIRERCFHELSDWGLVWGWVIHFTISLFVSVVIEKMGTIHEHWENQQWSSRWLRPFRGCIEETKLLALLQIIGSCVLLETMNKWHGNFDLLVWSKFTLMMHGYLLRM